MFPVAAVVVALASLPDPLPDPLPDGVVLTERTDNWVE